MTGRPDSLRKENARLRRRLARAGIDAAASDVAHKLQELLLAESHHRIKNILSMVQAITTQTLRAAPDLDTARDAIQSRIAALARAHDLLLDHHWDFTELKPLLATAVGAFDAGDRISITANNTEVSSPAAVSISLLVNELCTNAVKYGALSSTEGHVELTGCVDEAAGHILITWTESGGPPVQEPTHRGFGTQLIQTVTSGEVDLQFRPGGVMCTVTIPLA